MVGILVLHELVFILNVVVEHVLEGGGDVVNAHISSQLSKHNKQSQPLIFHKIPPTKHLHHSNWLQNEDREHIDELMIGYGGVHGVEVVEPLDRKLSPFSFQIVLNDLSNYQICVIIPLLNPIIKLTILSQQLLEHFMRL